MIKIDGVCKRFDKTVSLSDVSMTVPKGSIYGLIGTNGSGKSTLLRAMCGALRPQSGSITYGDMSVWENIDVKGRIVYLTDKEYFLPNSTMNDMKSFYESIYSGFDNIKYLELAKVFSIDPDKKLSGFSKGMQKQAAIILGLSCRPDYFLCDETFDGLDPVVRQLFKRLLSEETADRGMTTVISSHNLREIEDICDHIGVLHRGKMMFEGDIDDLRYGIHKVQLIFADGYSEYKLDGLDIVSLNVSGSIVTVVARGTEEEIAQALSKFEMKLYETVPLTLEEIFISEMGERGYDFSKVLL